MFAVTYLFDNVVARFQDEGTQVPNLFGSREPAKKLVTGNRITWVPGDPNGALGAMLPAKQPGRNPRPLMTIEELVTVEIQASDPSSPENERKQYEATRLLYDAWLRAVYLAARGTFRVVTSSWLNDKKERRHGAAIRVVLAIDAMVPDLAQEIAPVDTGANIDVHEFDVTDNLTVP
jgi:hypothetical protein